VNAERRASDLGNCIRQGPAGSRISGHGARTHLPPRNSGGPIFTRGSTRPRNKTQPTKVSVKGFIASVENATRRDDAKALLKLFDTIDNGSGEQLTILR
jgi:hypothetical protein